MSQSLVPTLLPRLWNDTLVQTVASSSGGIQIRVGGGGWHLVRVADGMDLCNCASQADGVTKANVLINGGYV